MMNLAKCILTTLIDALEKAGPEIKFFKTFRSVPSTYFGVTSIEGSHIVETTIENGHVVHDNYGRTVVVTERLVNGVVHYIERSLFNGGETDITDDVEEDEIMFSGSIEQCWYKWYQLTHIKIK